MSLQILRASKNFLTRPLHSLATIADPASQQELLDAFFAQLGHLLCLAHVPLQFRKPVGPQAQGSWAFVQDNFDHHLAEVT